MTSKRNVVLVQQPHAAQHAVERAGALARAAVAVVQERRAVHADADLDAAAADEVAPRVVDQGGVGLERLGDLEPADVAAFQRERWPARRTPPAGPSARRRARAA